MSIAEKQDGDRTFPVTADFARWVAGLNADAIPENAFTWASHALLDWFGVTIAGAREPLVEMLAAECEPAESAPCTLVGRAARSGLLDAALINGAASHALDYDDTHRRLHGHPTVCVAPVALALGEMLAASGRDVLTGFIAGVEVACNLGEMSDEGHYETGFHATGTMGAFGAACSGGKADAARPERDRACARHRRLAGRRVKDQLRHHDQAAACGQGSNERSAGGPARRARLHR